MQRLGQVILLVRGAPQRHILARLAKMNWLLSRALGHLAPMAVAHPAELAADIADHHADIRAFILIAHSVRLCITELAAQHACVIDVKHGWRSACATRRQPLCFGLLIVA